MARLIRSQAHRRAASRSTACASKLDHRPAPPRVASSSLPQRAAARARRLSTSRRLPPGSAPRCNRRASRARSLARRPSTDRPASALSRAALLVGQSLGDATLERGCRLLASAQTSSNIARQERVVKYASARACAAISARNSGCSSAIASRPISACRRAVARAGRDGARARRVAARAVPLAAARAARAFAQQFLADAEHLRGLARQQIELERIRDQPQNLGDLASAARARAPAILSPPAPAPAGNNRPAIRTTSISSPKACAPRSRTSVSGSKPDGMKMPRPSSPGLQEKFPARATRPCAPPRRRRSTRTRCACSAPSSRN